MDKQKKQALIKLGKGDRVGAVKAILPKLDKDKVIPISKADKINTIHYGDKKAAKKAIRNF